MKQSLKKELNCFFKAPPPLRKREFLQTLEQPQMSLPEFMFSQLGYIRKWVWGVSVLVFAASIIGAAMFSVDMLWGISALTPLLALTILSESGRSETYGMAELEMATRFSLRSVILARLGILGIENLLLFCMLLPVSIWNNMLSPIQAGIYILTPFMLTTLLGLLIVRTIRGREAIHLCMGMTACISFSIFFLHTAVPQLYHEQQLIWWAAVLALLCIGTAKQYYEMIKRIGMGTEE